MALARLWEWERTVERELPRVIAEREIETLFQPIYRLHQGDRSARGFEALSRFPAAPRIPLGLWYLTARDRGLASELEMASIMAAADATPRIHPDAFLTVNASRESLPALIPAIPAALRGRLLVELPYSAVRQPGSKWLFELLRREGAGVAVDDLTLGELDIIRPALDGLHPDCIKVDVVDGLAADPATRASLADHAAWCQEAEITLIAERVEEAGDIEALEEAGVEWAQGFGLSPPLEL
jgi:EAL domain-containing protein (putative c-di-GMP-specific phosphodiesterase class I)